MPSIWVSQEDYEALMSIKMGLERVRREPVSISKVVSYLFGAVFIPEIPPERGDEIIQKIEKLRSIVKKRVEGCNEVQKEGQPRCTEILTEKGE